LQGVAYAGHGDHAWSEKNWGSPKKRGGMPDEKSLDRNVAGAKCGTALSEKGKILGKGLGSKGVWNEAYRTKEKKEKGPDSEAGRGSCKKRLESGARKPGRKKKAANTPPAARSPKHGGRGWLAIGLAKKKNNLSRKTTYEKIEDRNVRGQQHSLKHQGGRGT